MTKPFSSSVPSQWQQGPQFLWQGSSTGPQNTEKSVLNITDEDRKVTYCSLTTIDYSDIMQEFSQYHSFDQLVEHEAQEQLKQASQTREVCAQDYAAAENSVLMQSQAMCFPAQLNALKGNKPLHSNRRLIALAPELDQSTGLIRVL